jgi:hypothetical protein
MRWRSHARRASAPAPDHLDRILAEWRRERPDLDLAPLGVLGRLLRAADLADAAPLRRESRLTTSNEDGSTCWLRCVVPASPTSATGPG